MKIGLHLTKLFAYKNCAIISAHPVSEKRERKKRHRAKVKWEDMTEKKK